MGSGLKARQGSLEALIYVRFISPQFYKSKYRRWRCSESVQRLSMVSIESGL